MMEMLKSKTMILFIVMMVGITFVSSHQTKLEDNKQIEITRTQSYWLEMMS